MAMGVDRAEVKHFALSSAPADIVNDVLVVDTHQWIELAAAKLTLSSTTLESS